MERNQNGYPHTTADNGGCGGTDMTPLDERLLAYAYVPIQRWRKLYSVEDALSRGTMFEELDKPMEVYGRE
ncbi:MAG: spore coat associated protein CotJA [Clostridia bacterium]|nr:spore coat associated protein CotJA [Clostridia bacterium]